MRFFRKSPVQTFILLPLAVLLCELALGLRLQPAGLTLMAWGYAQYRLVGRYRVRLGGGGPGLSGARRTGWCRAGSMPGRVTRCISATSST